jgi:hypothetical protein
MYFEGTLKSTQLPATLSVTEITVSRLQLASTPSSCTSALVSIPLPLDVRSLRGPRAVTAWTISRYGVD